MVWNWKVPFLTVTRSEFCFGFIFNWPYGLFGKNLNCLYLYIVVRLVSNLAISRSGTLYHLWLWIWMSFSRLSLLHPIMMVHYTVQYGPGAMQPCAQQLHLQFQSDRNRKCHRHSQFAQTRAQEPWAQFYTCGNYGRSSTWSHPVEWEATWAKRPGEIAMWDRPCALRCLDQNTGLPPQANAHTLK